MNATWFRLNLKRPDEEVEGKNAPFHAALSCTDEEAPILEAVLKRNGATQIDRFSVEPETSVEPT